MKYVKFILIALLVILPFSPILSNFSPYWIPEMTFQTYLMACAVFAIVSIILALFVQQKGRLFSVWGILFFLGLIISPPLSIGPPEMSAKLLERITEEHFRYGMLFFATLVFGVGIFFLLKKYWNKLSSVHKLILIPFIICIVLMIWDNYSSYNFSEDMKNWLASGKKAETFAMELNFNEFWRTLGRTIIYIIIPWISFILVRNGIVRKWQFIVFSVFSAIGIVFFFLTNFIGMQFYFPFMVPAIALAPAYWLGITLIQNKFSS